jgi:hypothetical protein
MCAWKVNKNQSIFKSVLCKNPIQNCFKQSKEKLRLLLRNDEKIHGS